MQKLILKSFLSPGDVVMLTAAVRDLQKAYPGEYLTDVRTSAPPLWENNPYITPLDEADPEVRVIDAHYPLVHQSNTTPYHFIHGYVQDLEQVLGRRIPLTAFKGDIHLSDQEKGWMSQVEETGFRGRFWIMMAGGKFDFTAKWWDPGRYQQVVDHFAGKILFVQCGEAGHWHPPLEGVLNLVGKTDTRQFVRLMYHADGVVCPVTFAMHLAAAVETKPGRPKNRACVVVAGGREPAQWEAYPHHQYISTNGALDCCDNGGCWRSRCQSVGDGDAKDHDLCIYPVEVAWALPTNASQTSPPMYQAMHAPPGAEEMGSRDPVAGTAHPTVRIPRCLDMISATDVIRRIEMYYQGGGAAIQRAQGRRPGRVTGGGDTHRASSVRRDWPSPNTIASAEGGNSGAWVTLESPTAKQRSNLTTTFPLPENDGSKTALRNHAGGIAKLPAGAQDVRTCSERLRLGI